MRSAAAVGVPPAAAVAVAVAVAVAEEGFLRDSYRIPVGYSKGADAPMEGFWDSQGLRGYQWVPKGSVWGDTNEFLWAFHGNTHGVLMGFPIGDFWCPMG